MRYLVTGSSGFIGRHLCCALRLAGHEVVEYDLKENLNIQDEATLTAMMTGCGGVFHLAAIPKVPFSVDHPVATTEANILGTVRVLNAARRAGVKRVVSFSSSAAKGVPPTSPYGLQKSVGEKFGRLFQTLYGMDVVSIRPHNVYGSGMSSMGAYKPVFLLWHEQYMRGDVCTVTGDGEQTRDFTHVSDVVAAAVHLMKHQQPMEGRVVDVGAGRPITVNRAKGLFLEVFPDARFVYVPERKGDQRHSNADLADGESLGWKPRVSPEQGVLELFRSWL